jgi:hypothetical protein
VGGVAQRGTLLSLVRPTLLTEQRGSCGGSGGGRGPVEMLWQTEYAPS